MKTKIESPIQENIANMTDILQKLGLTKREDKDLVTYAISLHWHSKFIHIFTTTDIQNIASNIDIWLSNECALRILKTIELEYDCHVGINIALIQKYIRQSTQFKHAWR